MLNCFITNITNEEGKKFVVILFKKIIFRSFLHGVGEYEVDNSIIS